MRNKNINISNVYQTYSKMAFSSENPVIRPIVNANELVDVNDEEVYENDDEASVVERAMSEESDYNDVQPEEVYDENQEDEDDNDETDDIAYNENIDEQIDTTEIEFDPSKHLQHLTLNEMTRIIININDMINNDVLNISLSESKSDYIFNAIVDNKFDIVIRRPVDLYTTIRVSLSQLKIDKVKLKQKLDTLFQ